MLSLREKHKCYTLTHTLQTYLKQRKTQEKGKFNPLLFGAVMRRTALALTLILTLLTLTLIGTLSQVL
jgi:hypothetical protein